MFLQDYDRKERNVRDYILYRFYNLHSHYLRVVSLLQLTVLLSLEIQPNSLPH